MTTNYTLRATGFKEGGMEGRLSVVCGSNCRTEIPLMKLLLERTYQVALLVFPLYRAYAALDAHKMGCSYKVEDEIQGRLSAVCSGCQMEFPLMMLLTRGARKDEAPYIALSEAETALGAHAADCHYLWGKQKTL